MSGEGETGSGGLRGQPGPGHVASLSDARGFGTPHLSAVWGHKCFDSDFYGSSSGIDAGLVGTVGDGLHLLVGEHGTGLVLVEARHPEGLLSVSGLRKQPWGHKDPVCTVTFYCP